MPSNAIPKAAAPDFLRDLDLTNDEVVYLLDLAAEVKRTPEAYAQALAGKSIALLFEKPSLRTRLTFELAIKQLGGALAFSGRARSACASRSRTWPATWTAGSTGIVARVFSQKTVEDLARWSSRAGDQRAERRVSSLPGAGRRADPARAFRRPAAD